MSRVGAASVPLLLLAHALPGAALDNGMGLTPAMGWSSWNTLACSSEFNETTVRQIADIMAEYYAPFGYTILALDDCWAASRDSNGVIQPDDSRFPSGMAALATYVISKGLQFGIYTDRGTKTCAGRPGSFGFEAVDAATYASWNVTYVKNDDCYSPENHTSEALYVTFRDAVNATGHAMYLNIKQDLSPHGFSAGAALGNSWRVANDIVADGRDLGRLMDAVAPLSRLAAPGAWNDLDSLEIGVPAQPPLVPLAYNESVAQFSLWCVAASQLMMGHDLRAGDGAARAIVTNAAAIRVNQDTLGVAGVRLRVGRTGRDEVWGRPLSDGDFAVVVWNRNTSVVCTTCAPVTTSVAFWADLGFTGNATVTDLWTGADLGVVQDVFAPAVPPTSVVFVRVSPVHGQHELTGRGYWGARATRGVADSFWA